VIVAEPTDARAASRRAEADQFYFSMGRVALYALLRALKVGPTDEVIVPVYTCPAVIEPVARLGARAVYCDIERASFGLCPDALERALTEKTKAVVIQHTFGVPARLDELMKAARDRGVAILEDCCHVSSSSYHGAPLGYLGDAAFYSHDWGKPLPIGGGGVAVVNSPSLLEGFKRVYSEFVAASFVDEARIVARTAYLAAHKWMRILLPSIAGKLRSREAAQPNGDASPGSKLRREYGKRMPRSLEHRLRYVQRNSAVRLSARKWTISGYEAGFRSIGIECFRSPEGCDLALWRYPIFAADKSKLLAEAARYGASVADWGTVPLRLLTNGSSDRRSRRCCFPVAEEVARRVVTLPIREARDGAEVDRTLEFLSGMKKCGFL
jgi:perosamine synthetase